MTTEVKMPVKRKLKPKEYVKLQGTLIARNWDKYVMLAPFFIIFTIFTVIPVVAAIILSFTDYNMVQTPGFVGFDNYIRLLLSDTIFPKAIKNTLVFAVITGPLSYFACLMLAWFVNELGPKLRTLMTLMFYAPSISGSLYMIWSLIFSGDMYGWANGILMSWGLIDEPILWLSDPQYNLTIIMVVQVWASLGTGFLAFVAGFQNVDTSLYEAGAVDGVSNRWQELLHITLPSMGPQLLFGAVMQIASSFAAGDICVAFAGNPSTDYSAATILTHIYDVSGRYEMGYACAISTVLFVLMIFANVGVRKVLQKYL